MNDDVYRNGAGMDDGTEFPASGAGGIDLGRVWTGVAAEVWRRRPGPVRRRAARLLLACGVGQLGVPGRTRPAS